MYTVTLFKVVTYILCATSVLIYFFCCQGHNCCPYQYSYKGPGALEFVKKLDIPKQTSKGGLSAMQHFRNLDKKATDEENNEMETLHQNSITWESHTHYTHLDTSAILFCVALIMEYFCAVLFCAVLCCFVLCCVMLCWPCRELCVMSGDKAKVEKYSSLGLDGAMVIWDFKVHKHKELLFNCVYI